MAKSTKYNAAIAAQLLSAAVANSAPKTAPLPIRDENPLHSGVQWVSTPAPQDPNWRRSQIPKNELNKLYKRRERNKKSRRDRKKNR